MIKNDGSPNHCLFPEFIFPAVLQLFHHRNCIKILFLLITISLLSIFTTGCDDSVSGEKATQVKIIRGNGQMTFPQEPFEQKLAIRVFADSPGLFGKTKSVPLRDEKIRFLVPSGSDLKIDPAEISTDLTGSAEVTVTAGSKIGDQYIWIEPASNPEKRVEARFISGVKINGGLQERSCGLELKQPLSLQVVRPDGTPAKDVQVYFNLLRTPNGKNTSEKISTPITRTDENGIAETNFTVGDITGKYELSAEVADPATNCFIRSLPIQVLGINVASVIISVLGGLALFIFGMKQMSDGLQKVAGEKMKQILHFFASNRVVAIGAGALVTAVIQSSSATTVMVIGFINAGLLNLVQGIGIIFGANIGTTITAQVISFNLNGVAMPAIFIGLMGLFSKRRIISGWGETVMGFGMLFFGMQVMSAELKTLGIFPTFIDIFASFNCEPAAGSFMPIFKVLAAIGIGAVLTFIIQSSSAAMGIILALAAANLINFYTAIPLLLGTNIGTTITAFLASFAANRLAKQAAMAHFLFNVFGTIVMVILSYVPWNGKPCFLYLVNMMTPGDAFDVIPQNIERHIAMAHTLFNVITMLVLSPFIGQIAKLCNILIPVRDAAAIKTQRLEPRLLDTPSIALEQAVFAIRAMVKDACRMVDEAVNQQFLKMELDPKKVRDLEERESVIDATQHEVTDYLVEITRRPLSLPQSSLVPLLMHCTNDAERIADHTANIIKLTERMVKTDKKISEVGRKDIRKIWEVLARQAEDVISALGSVDNEKIRIALKSERKINKLTTQSEDEHIERLRKGNCNVLNSVIFIEMLGELEKVGDHLSNIAERTPEIQKHYIHLN